MARTFLPNEEVAQNRWRDQDIERFNSYTQNARDHALGRNLRVISVLCYLQLMRSSGLLSSWAPALDDNPDEDTEVLTGVVRAEYQNYRAPGALQAAHYLPGQLKINGLNPWDCLKDRTTKTAFRSIFADVQTLPANFNKADTQAESSGLCQALASAAAEILRCTVPSAPLRIDRMLIRRVYASTWVRYAEAAYAQALERKGQKFMMPEIQCGEPGGIHFHEIINLKERTSMSPYQWAITTQRYILEAYAAETRNDASVFQESRMLELERTFTP